MDLRNCDLVLQENITIYFFLRVIFKHNFFFQTFQNLYSRLKKSNKVQLYADIYLPLNYSTCFGLPSRLSSGVHKTVVAASGTDHTIWGASFLKRDQIRIV